MSREFHKAQTLGSDVGETRKLSLKNVSLIIFINVTGHSGGVELHLN